MNKRSIKSRRVGFKAILFMAEEGFHFIPWDENKGRPVLKWNGENQKNFTYDTNKLLEWQAQGYKRFLYLPGISGFIGFDIDCGHADGRDGLLGFYEIMLNLGGKIPERLPCSLRDLPNNFPCYVETPSGGWHLLFKYSGPCKTANLIYENHKLEVKYLKSGLFLGRKPNKAYVLCGNPKNAPELPRFLMELINPQPKPKLKPKLAVNKRREMPNLEKILDGVLAASNGNNERQMKFAWKAAYFHHELEEVLSFVMSRPDVFGNGSDTEIVVNYSWRGNTARATF
jgi:hypothetical protein